jgi:uncharacterized protein YaiL (DUF2058 family)
MQNLRDKLLKAGLVSADDVKKAEQKRPPRPEPRRESEDERKVREAFAAREAEKAEERKREAAKVQEARMQSQRAKALQALVREHKIQDALGEVPFHYVKRSGKIGKLALNAPLAGLLEKGQAAVVEDPGQPEAVVVPAKAAEKFYAVDAKSIRFWAGPDKPVGFDDVGGEGGDEPAASE